MERQRSFSFKPTRLLVFSFTIFSSIVFLSNFTIWVKRFSPTVHQPTHIQFNRSLSGGLLPLPVHNFTGFTRNSTVDGVKIPAFIENLHSWPDNSSDVDSYSGPNSEVPEDGEHKAYGNTSGGDFSAMQDHFVQETSSGVVKNEQSNTIFDLDEKTEVPSGDGKEQKITEASFKKIEVLIEKKIEQKTVKDCDLTKGSWVFDESYPLYTKDSCPFIDEGFDCDGNGRLDRSYFKWRWQPQDCDLPRYYQI